MPSYLDLADTTAGHFKSETLDNTLDLIDGNNWLLLSVYYAHSVSIMLMPFFKYSPNTPSYRFPNLSKTLKKSELKAYLVINIINFYLVTYLYSPEIQVQLQTKALDSSLVLTIIVQSQNLYALNFFCLC